MVALLPKPSQTPPDRKDEWGTPDYLFRPLHERWQFTVDAAADAMNTKLHRFWTKEDDGLAQSWRGETVWCNPPYSEYDRWIEKAADSCVLGNADVLFDRGAYIPLVRTRVVMLLPNALEKKVFHRWKGHIAEVWFIKGRVKFIGGGQHGPNFGSALLVFDSQHQSSFGTHLRWYDPRKDELH